jgi:hypothetical protein
MNMQHTVISNQTQISDIINIDENTTVNSLIELEEQVV